VSLADQILILALFHELAHRKLVPRCFPEQQSHQFHLVEIPKILVVEASDGLVLVLEIS
jgi:hypothetical protein